MNLPAYLHYQTKSYNFIPSNIYINITNEKGEEIVNKDFDLLSNYIKIEPNVKYYAHINIYKNIITAPAGGIFSLKYEKYKNNILVKDENEVKRLILSHQNYTFLKTYQMLKLMNQLQSNVFIM